MVRAVNQTFCGDHFTVYTNTEYLHCTPETNIMLNVSYTSVKKVKNDINSVNISKKLIP